LLLAHEKSLVQTNDFYNKANRFVSVYENMENLKNWQVKVKKDSKEFLNMFTKLDLVPDIMGIHGKI
jgi:hypothetical protein